MHPQSSGLNNEQVCGFVAILGVPNAGKSTLVNALVGSKVSIVSPKVQTTRRRILGIVSEESAQLLLMDTPGIFSPNKDRKLEKSMVDAAWGGLKEADVAVVVIDCKHPDLPLTLPIINRVDPAVPLIIALNKVDAVAKEKLLEIAAQLASYTHVKNIVMISALKREGISDMKRFIIDQLPKGPWLYPADQLMDINERIWAAEITREELYFQLQQELPYQIYVETEAFETFDNGSVKISQAIVLAKANHKGMVLGHKGQRLKAIGERSRKQMMHHLGITIHLKLFVKVRDDWFDKPWAAQLAGITS